VLGALAIGHILFNIRNTFAAAINNKPVYTNTLKISDISD